MDQLSDVQLEKVINNVSIFCRVTPKHKLTIVKVILVPPLLHKMFFNSMLINRLFNELVILWV